MQNYLNYFDSIPLWLVMTLMAVFAIMQGVGEFLVFKGRIVPEFMNIRKAFIRKKKEKEALHQMTELLPTLVLVPDAIKKNIELLENVDRHYSHDNITMRDNWMQSVNNSIDEMHQWIKEVNAKLDKNSEDTLAIRVENMRDTIIDFASYVSKEHNPVTREQFNRIFRMHDEYEEIIEASGKTNGEVDIAIKIIKASYEKHLCTRTFIEDSWGEN